MARLRECDAQGAAGRANRSTRTIAPGLQQLLLDRVARRALPRPTRRAGPDRRVLRHPPGQRPVEAADGRHRLFHLRPDALSGHASCDVHSGQRFAPTGMSDAQYGHVFFGATASATGGGYIRLIWRTSRNTKKATIRNSRIVLMNSP